jgi:hypothetical protein
MNLKGWHPESREAAMLVAFVVGGFVFGLLGLVVIILFFMKYS